MRRASLLIFISAAIAMLSIPVISRAEIVFEPAPVGGTLKSLPRPVSEFIGNFKDINKTINSEVGRYIGISPIEGPINFTKISQLNLTQWIRGLLQIPVIKSVYSAVVKILQAVGNLVIWTLGTLSDLIRQGLSYLR